MSSRKLIKASIRNELLLRIQCANSPMIPAIGCRDYICPLWKCNNGYFDESGKQIDHIIEVARGGTNDISNLQVICPCCHAVKTKRCAHQNWNLTSIEIDYGVAKMETNKRKKI
jgi:5-methylcytosine-specific restriction endonuclease McrA